MPALENPTYRFCGFELEPAERRLSQAGRLISLTPKVFDTLVLLVQRAGHVVSKDELMQALWPRGYVDESNLTKHIWLIRRALGDGEQNSRFIETVTKIGYRFVAPVSTAPAEAVEVAVAPAAVAARTPPRPRWVAAAAATLAACALAALAVWWVRMESAGNTVAGHVRTVALVGFNNLSRESRDAWLAPALAELLGTELNVVDAVRVVPDELVRGASGDVPPPAAGGYTGETLARLRRRLAADYIISGSYLVTGASQDAPLRLDITLQDARDGRVLASVSEQAGDTQLVGLVNRAGSALRDKLGVTTRSDAGTALVAGQQPPSLDVARRMGLAIDALQHYDPARARDELLEAVAESPGYAPAYTRLAEAWAELGYHDKALAAAEQAVRHATGLPREQQLLTEAVADATRPDWGRAAAAWQALVTLRPDNPEYRLKKINAQIAAGDVAGAQTSVLELQRLPDSGADPRVELAAAQLAGARDDARGAANHAAAALRLARAREAGGLIADAQLALAGARMYINENEQARADLAAAIDAYRSTGNPHGEAAARGNLAAVLLNLHRGQEAREEYQRAMVLYQGIGDLTGVASVYRDLCAMLWMTGDRDGAQAAARHSLELARQTGNLRLQTWTLRALATIASDDAASDEVLQEYREVIDLNERDADQGGHVWSLVSYADVERMRGELGEARRACDQAKSEAAHLSDPQFAIFSGFTCALLDVDTGSGDVARRELQEVMRRIGSGGDDTNLYNSLLELAQLDMDDGRWAAARDQLQRASRGFTAVDEQTGEADAEAMLALCEQQLGNRAARDAAAARARALRQSINSRQEVYAADLALARIADGAQARDAAATRLLALAADAEQRHWLSWALEARLAAWQLLQAQGNDRARNLGHEIQSAASAHGYARILHLLQRGAGPVSLLHPPLATTASVSLPR